jgi:hypothetical protein
MCPPGQPAIYIRAIDRNLLASVGKPCARLAGARGARQESLSKIDFKMSVDSASSIQKVDSDDSTIACRRDAADCFNCIDHSEVPA